MAEHEFSALWWNLGQYGRQDVHLHVCQTDTHRKCHVELVGEGAACGGKGTPHYPLRLEVGSVWSQREATGTPLSQYGLPLARPES